MKPYTILVISRGKASLGRMFQGYIQYFKKDNLQIAVASTDIRTIHPLAIDVMNEDGIELDQNLTLDYMKYNLASFDRVLVLGYLSPSVIEKLDGINFEQLNITDPLKANSYNSTLDAYRTAREEIKKICLEIIGSFDLIGS